MTRLPPNSSAYAAIATRMPSTDAHKTRSLQGGSMTTMSRPHAASRDLATLDDFVPGQTASFSKTIGEVELALFVAVCGDVNPLHVDEEFARRTFFGGRLAHGPLSASLVSTVIGTLLPGTGAIYKSQSLRFLRPVHPGDTLTATVEVRDL